MFKFSDSDIVFNGAVNIVAEREEMSLTALTLLALTWFLVSLAVALWGVGLF